AKIGLLLKGTGALLDAGTGGAINANLAIVVTSILFVTYGMAGGLGAAVVTDFIQGVLTLLFSFMLLPFVLSAVGGLSGAKATLESAGLGDKWSLVAPGDIGLFWILMMSIQVIIGIVALPSAMGNSAAGKTELEGRVGYMTGTFIKRVCTAAWCLTGIGALAFYIQQGADLSAIHPDSVYGDMAREFLPVGLMGVFIASLLAGIMSSCDSFMISAAALFTENLYRPLRPHQSISHYLWVGRIGAVAIVIAGVIFAFWLSGVIAGLMIWLKILPMMGIAFWLGLIWRKTTPLGAWASTLAAFAAWWLAERRFFAEWLNTLPFADALHLTTGSAAKLEMYEPWLIVFYMVAAIATGVLVSLFTRTVPEERLNRYYQLTRTPIVPGEEIEIPCQLPAGVQPANRKMLITSLGLEIPMPSKLAIQGFSAGSIGVVLLIAGFIWIAS
ncbi:MAG: sodium:solute symporter family protein, partial [Verrucomicrobiae bacterium]|nr:sodium:solute symporter family protein [Verrucomicrobiae bacterium]